MTESDIQRVAEAAVRAALSQTTRLSRDDAADLAAAAANKAVNEAHIRLFAHLGYDLANKDDINRLRSTLDFSEALRMRSASAGKAILNAVAVAIALFLLGLLAFGARVSVGGVNQTQGPPFIK